MVQSKGYTLREAIRLVDNEPLDTPLLSLPADPVDDKPEPDLRCVGVCLLLGCTALLLQRVDILARQLR